MGTWNSPPIDLSVCPKHVKHVTQTCDTRSLRGEEGGREGSKGVSVACAGACVSECMLVRAGEGGGEELRGYLLGGLVHALPNGDPVPHVTPRMRDAHLTQQGLVAGTRQQHTTPPGWGGHIEVRSSTRGGGDVGMAHGGSFGSPATHMRWAFGEHRKEAEVLVNTTCPCTHSNGTPYLGHGPQPQRRCTCEQNVSKM
jgi:hypothetical protein